MFLNNIFSKKSIFDKYIKHNNYYFKKENNLKTNDSKILVEFNNFTSNHVGNSYLANELKKHDIYITASENEPSGNHHMEGALCGLPILYKDSGSRLRFLIIIGPNSQFP